MAYVKDFVEMNYLILTKGDFNEAIIIGSGVLHRHGNGVFRKRNQ